MQKKLDSSNFHQIKVYGRGKKFPEYRALKDYYITAKTLKAAAKEALARYRKTYFGMIPELVEIGGCRRCPGAGKILWVGRGVKNPVNNFI